MTDSNDSATQDLVQRAQRGLGTTIDLAAEAAAARITLATGVPVKPSNIVERIQSAIQSGELTEAQVQKLIEARSNGSGPATPAPLVALLDAAPDPAPPVPGISALPPVLAEAISGSPNARAPQAAPQAASQVQAAPQAAPHAVQATPQVAPQTMPQAAPQAALQAAMPQAAPQAATPATVAADARKQIHDLCARANTHYGRPAGVDVPSEHRARRIALPLGEAELPGGGRHTFEATVPIFLGDVPFAELRKLQILPYGADRCVLVAFLIDDIDLLRGAGPSPGTMLTRADGAPTGLVYPGAVVRATFINVSPTPIRLSPSAQIIPLERDRATSPRP